jgi:hypothetical protein
MAKTGHPNFVIDFKSPWRGTIHTWSITSSHSGSSFTTSADMIAFLQSVFEVIRTFISASDALTFVSGVKYYNGSASSPLYELTFANEAAAAAAGYALGGGAVSASQGEAFTGGTSTQLMSGLECCTILQAPVGLSSTGKPVFLKKFIHCAPAATGDSDLVPFSSGAGGFAATLGNGGLYGSRVLISATGKQGAWAPYAYFGNHQMLRRRKKATSTSLTTSLLRFFEGAGGDVAAAAESLIP